MAGLLSLNRYAGSYQADNYFLILEIPPNLTIFLRHLLLLQVFLYLWP